VNDYAHAIELVAKHGCSAPVSSSTAPGGWPGSGVETARQALMKHHIEHGLQHQFSICMITARYQLGLYQGDKENSTLGAGRSLSWC
jgi:hypothetical protein